MFPVGAQDGEEVLEGDAGRDSSEVKEAARWPWYRRLPCRLPSFVLGRVQVVITVGCRLPLGVGCRLTSFGLGAGFHLGWVLAASPLAVGSLRLTLLGLAMAMHTVKELFTLIFISFLYGMPLSSIGYGMFNGFLQINLSTFHY